MFKQSIIQQVNIRIRNKEKQQSVTTDLAISQCGQIALSQLSNRIRVLMEIDDSPLIFYYDCQQGIYVMLQYQDTNVSCSSILNEGIIELRVEDKISDQLLANPEIKEQEVRQRRSPQRDIIEAFQLAQQWRYLSKNGTFNQKGQWEKMNFDKSAGIVGIPRKTLEDYHLLLRNGHSLGFDFHSHRRRKIGILRSFVKQMKKTQKQKQKQGQKQKGRVIDQEKILKDIRTQLFSIQNQEMQESIFKVLDSHSSDEDAVRQDFQFEH